MAGFRIGRGRDSRSAQQQAPQGGQQYGQQQYGQPYGRQPVPPHAPRHQQQWQQPPAYGGGPPGTAPGGRGYGGDEPEYFGAPDPYHAQGGPGQGAPGHGGHGHGPDPYADNSGHTQAFSIGEAPDAYGYGPDQGNGPYDDGSSRPHTYRADRPSAPPAGPRLHWKELLSGIVLRPGPTFWRMRDYPVWGPALIVTFIYGLIAVLGFDTAREDVLRATLSSSIPWALSTGVAVVISGLVLGAVTHTLARQLGGDGSWAPTVGLSMLIMSITDAPRLLFAMFLGGDSSVVQVLGWVTWVAAGALFTSMVSKSHDLPWPKALGASAIQLIALLSLIKLGTL